MKSEVFARLAQSPMNYRGFNLSGIPLGDDEGYRSMRPHENMSHLPEDSLVPVGNLLLVRPMYFDMGFTTEERLFLREPALMHLAKVDRFFREKLDLAVRVTDGYRHMIVQQKGFCWAVEQVLKLAPLADMKMNDLCELVKSTLRNGHLDDNVEMMEGIFSAANNLFSYAGVAFHNSEQSSAWAANKVPEIIPIAAVNLGWSDAGTIDLYSTTAHGSGGEVDIELVNMDSGKPVCMGTPVDGQGIFSHLTYFEPKVGTLTAAECSCDEANRRMMYREAIRTREDISAYLCSCGIDPDVAVNDHKYFSMLWRNIRGNRRVLDAVMHTYGAFPYVGEWWHWGLNNSRGGILCQQFGFVSGSACYAVHMGQQHCAWGNATRQYEHILRAPVLDPIEEARR